MTQKNFREEPKLSEEDLGELTKFFALLIKMDERNKREGRYDELRSEVGPLTVSDKDGNEVIL